MKKYIELKIRRKYIIILSIVLISICSFGGYYIWCYYHPDIHIQIGNGSTGKDVFKIEAPTIAFTGRGIAESAASIQLKIQNITMQHEFFCEFVKNQYKGSDIKLDINFENNQTILRYYGTVTNSNNEIIDFEEEIKCDFLLDADIQHN